jgi:hypothetical protein
MLCLDFLNIQLRQPYYLGKGMQVTTSALLEVFYCYVYEAERGWRI